jgi:large subunit ribosomal protein L17
MRHKINKKKLSRRTSHRISLFRNLCKSLINKEQLCTTLVKAKSVRSIIEKIITRGKEDNINTKKLLLSKLGGSIKEVNKILDTLSIRYKQKKGGYTRIIKVGPRKGDCAPMAIIQLIH